MRRLFLFGCPSLVLLIAAAALLGPRLARDLVKDLVTGGVEDALDVQASIETLSFSLLGHASVGGLVLEDAQGRPLVRVDTLDARVGLIPLLQGALRARCEVDGLELHVRPGEEPGSLQWLELVRSEGPLESDELHESDAPHEPSSFLDEELPEVSLEFTLADARVVVHAPSGGDLTIERIQAALDLEDLRDPATFDLELELVGPGEPGAPFALSGELTALAPGGGRRLELGRTSARAQLSLDDLELGALAPLLALLGQPLPAGVSGPVSIQLDLAHEPGAEPVDPRPLLAGAKAKARIGLGALHLPGLEAGGNVELEASSETVELGADLDANQGKLGMHATVDLHAEDASPVSRVRFELESVRLGGELAHLLAELHPAFHTATGEAALEVSSLVSGHLALEYAGPIPDELTAESFDPDRVIASGRLALDETVLSSSPLLASLLEALGEPADRQVELDPIGFRFDGGTLTYDEPWSWTIDGHQTFFRGGFTRTGLLDLEWLVPISEGLASQVKELRPLVGRELVVPVTGTPLAPELGFDTALRELLSGALQDTVQDTVQEKVDELVEEAGLDQGLQGIAEGVLGGEALYDRAGDLWKAGKQDEARAIYRRIKAEFPTTYLLHRSKIKKRLK